MGVERFEVGKDANGEEVGAPTILTYTSGGPLVANTAIDITVPSGAKYALFSATTNIWVDQEATAVIPVVVVDDGTAPCLNPSARQVTAGETLSIISDANGHVTVEFYS